MHSAATRVRSQLIQPSGHGWSYRTTWMVPFVPEWSLSSYHVVVRQTLPDGSGSAGPGYDCANRRANSIVTSGRTSGWPGSCIPQSVALTTIDPATLPTWPDKTPDIDAVTW